MTILPPKPQTLIARVTNTSTRFGSKYVHVGSICALICAYSPLSFPQAAVVHVPRCCHAELQLDTKLCFDRPTPDAINWLRRLLSAMSRGAAMLSCSWVRDCAFMARYVSPEVHPEPGYHVMQPPRPHLRARGLFAGEESKG